MKKKYFPYSNDIVCGLLIFLFVYTATSKFIDFNSFRFVISKAPFIGNFSFVAVLIPLVEIIISLLLFFKSTRLSGLYSSAILLMLFTIYIGYLLFAGKILPCECGGVIRQMSWPQHLLFNLAFIALAILGIRQLKLKPLEI